MKECKICRTKAVVNSEIISGLCCCRMCGKFFLEGMVADSTLSVGQILREEIKLSGYKDTLLAHDSIHVVAQLRHVDSAILNAFTVVLDSCSHVILDLMRLSQEAFDPNARTIICNGIEVETGLNSALVSFIVDTYAYALGLMELPIEYSNDGASSVKLKVNRFAAERTSIKCGESVRLFWDVSQPDAVVAISDGFHQWCVPASGSLTVKPSKDRIYTLTAVKGGYSVSPEVVKIHMVKPVNINSLKVSKQKVYEGQSVNVSWKVSGATHIELLVNDGYEYRKVEDVTSLRNKEIRLVRDSQIILTCYNDCYQAQKIVHVQVKGAPRFPIQELTCLKHLPEINILGPALPVMYGRNQLLTKRLEQLKKSEKGLYSLLKGRVSSSFKSICSLLTRVN